MLVTEGAPVIGVALSTPLPGQTTIPVFVTLRLEAAMRRKLVFLLAALALSLLLAGAARAVGESLPIAEIPLIPVAEICTI